MEGLKWLATIPLNVHAPIPHAPITANAVSAFYIIAEAGKSQDASFHHPAKDHMIGLLRIYIRTTKRMADGFL